ncbi:MAG: hypothetical protein IKP22_03455 [Clostridia bacterium]|nr:hypothetical protein [Clostridia bacterium]
MAFFPPVPLIRRNVILNRLRNCGAVSEQMAKTFAEAGIINPNGFKHITENLVKRGTIHRTPDGRYYV